MQQNFHIDSLSISARVFETRSEWSFITSRSRLPRSRTRTSQPGLSFQCLLFWREYLLVACTVLQKQVWILTRDIFFSVLQIELRKENWVRSTSISIRSTRWTRLGFSCWFRSSSVTPSIAFAVGLVHLERWSRCATDRSRSVLHELFEWWMCDAIHYSSTVLCNDWNLEVSRHEFLSSSYFLSRFYCRIPRLMKRMFSSQSKLAKSSTQTEVKLAPFVEKSQFFLAACAPVHD